MYYAIYYGQGMTVIRKLYEKLVKQIQCQSGNQLYSTSDGKRARGAISPATACISPIGR